MPFDILKAKSKEKYYIKEILVFILVSAVIVIPYYWWKDTSDSLTLKLIIYLQDYDPKLQFILSGISNVVTKLTSHLVISTIIFNFSNVFKLFVCNLVFFLAIGVSALLKLIYIKPMLFLLSQNTFIEPLDCLFTWATPCTPAVYLVSMTLTLWWMYIPNHNKIFKYMIIIIGIILITFVNCCLLSQGIYSVNDLIFSTLLGALIFIFIFKILRIDVENSYDMRLLLNKCYLYSISIGGISIGVITLYLFHINPNNNKYVQQLSYTDCYFKWPDNLDISLDSILLLIVFATNTGMVLGLYLEKRFLSAKNEYAWGFFNFQNDQNDMESIYSFNDKYKNAQWNDTSCNKTVARCFISLLFGSCFILAIHFIPYSIEFLCITLIFKYFLSMLFYIFSIFFLQKYIFIKLDLVNTNAFEYGSNNSPNSLKISRSSDDSLTLEERLNS